MMIQKIKQTGIFLLRVYDSFCDACLHISGWAMLGISLVVGFEVVMRYFFNSPTTWTGDFTDYTLLYATVLAGAWLLKHDAHVKLTILIDTVPQKFQLVLKFIQSLLGISTCGFIIWYGVLDTLDALQRGMLMDRPIPVPQYFILGVIPFGFFLILIQFMRNAFKSLSDLKGRS